MTSPIGTLLELHRTPLESPIFATHNIDELQSNMAISKVVPVNLYYFAS